MSSGYRDSQEKDADERRETLKNRIVPRKSAFTRCSIAARVPFGASRTHIKVIMYCQRLEDIGEITQFSLSKLTQIKKTIWVRSLMHCLFTLVKIQKAIGSDLKQDFEVDRWASRFKYSPINWWEFAQMLDFVRNVLHNIFDLFIEYRKREAIEARKRVVWERFVR